MFLSSKIRIRRISGKVAIACLLIMAGLSLSACGDKSDESVTIPSVTADTDPMSILGKSLPSKTRPVDTAGGGGKAVHVMGLSNLGHILNVFGVFSAVTIIIASLVALLVVNYPKTVAQTKQRIVHALFTVVVIAALPLIMDVIVTLMLVSTGGG